MVVWWLLGSEFGQIGLGWVAIELVCLGFWVVGCWWAWGGRGVVGGFKMCLDFGEAVRVAL